MSTRTSRTVLFALVALVALLVGLALLAPEEATLGSRMRWVYLHVSFSWAGTLLVNMVGLGGLYLIARPNAMRASRWVIPAQLSGFTLFAIGFGFSLIASSTSWGGILWMEPRVLSTAYLLAGGIAVTFVEHLLIRPRFIGIFAVALSIGWSVTLRSTGRIFHPDDPIGTSGSSAIQMTFYALTIVTIGLGVVIAMILRPTPRKPVDSG